MKVGDKVLVLGVPFAGVTGTVIRIEPSGDVQIDAYGNKLWIYEDEAEVIG